MRWLTSWLARGPLLDARVAELERRLHAVESERDYWREALFRALDSDEAREAESARRLALLQQTYGWIVGTEQEYPRRGLAAELAAAQEQIR